MFSINNGILLRYKKKQVKKKKKLGVGGARL